MLMASAPPSVLRPKTGLEPGSSCIDAIAFCGRRSQLTTSAKASLMRTPSWNTDSPCGVPSSGDAVKPRKLKSGWKSLPLGELTTTLLALNFEELRDARRCAGARGSRAPNDWTLDGTCPSGVPRPGSGAVPMTSIGGRCDGLACARWRRRRATTNATGSAMRAATDAPHSADRHAPRQLADRNLGDLLVRRRCR